MVFLKILYRVARHYWYIPLILLALVILYRLGLLSWLNSSNLNVLSTPTKIEKVSAIGQLITAQYYGESLASLDDVYQDMDENELSDHYDQIQHALLTNPKGHRQIHHQKYYSLFKEVADIRKKSELDPLIAHTSWQDFQQKYQSNLTDKIQYYADLKSDKAKLVYLGRGTVQVGFDLGLLKQYHLEGSADTIILRHFDPIIFPPEINPWLSADKEMPGFQVVSEHKDQRLSIEQIGLVKAACLEKLKQQAIEKGILQQAIKNAETELAAFFSQLEGSKKVVQIIPSTHIELQHKVLSDSIVSQKEVVQVAHAMAQKPNDSTGHQILVHNIERSPAHKHGAWQEVTHAVSHSLSKVPPDPPLSTPSSKTLTETTSKPTVDKTPGPETHPRKHILEALRHRVAERGSAHSKQARHYARKKHKTEADWDQAHQITAPPPDPTPPKKRKPEHKTFGWHPTWMGSAYNHYRYDLLWGISYFGGKLDHKTGNIPDLHDWGTTKMVDQAKAAGTRVYFTVSNFGFSKNRVFLNNPKAQEKLINLIPDILAQRKAHGVNIDFEQVPAKSKKAFNDFLINLSDKLKREGYTLTVCLYAVDFSKVFDIPRLKDAVEVFTMMGYDYYYAGSKKAGPVSPLAPGHQLAPNYNLENSVDDYLKRGVPPDKFIVALPYYGSEWKTASSSIPSATNGHVRSPSYRQIRKGTDTQSDIWLEDLSAKVHKSTKDSQHQQLWYDDVQSLRKKYQMLKQKGVAGPGIWALGYDNGYNDLWNLLQAEFGEQP